MRIAVWFYAALAAVLVSGPAWAEFRCGSKEVKDKIEDDSIEFLKTTTQNLLPQLKSEAAQFDANNYLKRIDKAELDILESEYEVDLSEMYQISENSDVRMCNGKLQLTSPAGGSSWKKIDYKVINTEDGKLVVEADTAEATNSILNALEELIQKKYIE